MSSRAWPDGHGRVILESVDSTNAEAARQVGSLAPPCWIMAHRQTQGRGRHGRAWADPAGNLAATLILRPPPDIRLAALRSFVAGLGVYDALADATGRIAGLALKWPNDVLVNGGKVSGILLETAGFTTADPRLLIGIGVNLAETPDPGSIAPGTAPPTNILAETGAAIPPTEFLDLLAPAVAAWEARLTGDGFAPLRRAFLDRAARLGETVTARTGQGALTGRYDDIDPSGAIVLTTETGPRAIPAADILF